jgi:hypothetical protein
MPVGPAILFAMISMMPAQESGSANLPAICRNKYLLQAVREVDRACTDVSCDFTRLNAIENIPRADLLTALRDANLLPVHIFFPVRESRLESAFDWRTTKRDQLETLRAASRQGGKIFLLGKASVTGAPGVKGDEYNRQLSIARMEGVRNYLKALGIQCEYKGGFFGREIFQLNKSDARLLNVEPTDFRNDPLILNQAVHVFVYPCPELL